ncbi:MAG: 4'-phosphopantetheinyl transferase superfamily protein [Litoreibacter sp.]|nr:4'-phosphopantetheinyl transferase superfamily protein [Litoreibacter sp.]MCY4333147.1 4'-phosphopantetheinyl transferase superfamily protein [Litoreibacter sp.]
MTERTLLRWIVSDDLTDAQSSALLVSLDQTEQDRAMRFRFAEDRRDYVAAHALTRFMLGDVTGQAPKDLRFVFGRYGKPALLTPSGQSSAPAFNLSHTRGCVAVALSATGDIGVDVEAISRTVPDGIADRYFSRPELEAIHTAPDKDMAERFFTYWTLKEAYLKATGLGINIPLDRFAVAHDPPRLLFGPDEDHVAWHFHVERAASGFVIAVAHCDAEERAVTVSSAPFDLTRFCEISGFEL